MNTFFVSWVARSTVFVFLFCSLNVGIARQSDERFFLGMFEQGESVQFKLSKNVFIDEEESLIELGTDCDCLRFIDGQDDLENWTLEYTPVEKGVSYPQVILSVLTEDGNESERVVDCFSLVTSKILRTKSFERTYLSAQEFLENRDEFIVLDIRSLDAFEKTHIKGALNVELGENSRLSEILNTGKEIVVAGNEWEFDRIDYDQNRRILSMQEYGRLDGPLVGGSVNVANLFQVRPEDALKSSFFDHSSLIIIGSISESRVNPVIFNGVETVVFEADNKSLSKAVGYLKSIPNSESILISAPDSGWYSQIIAAIQKMEKEFPQVTFVEGGNTQFEISVQRIAERRSPGKSKQSYTSSQLTRSGVYVPGSSKRVVGAGCSTCSGR